MGEGVASALGWGFPAASIWLSNQAVSWLDAGQRPGMVPQGSLPLGHFSF